MKTVIAYTVSLLLPISMSAGVFYQIEGLVTLAVAINWMLCILAIPIAVIIVVASAMYERSGEDTKVKLAKLLVDAAKKKTGIARFIGWVTFIAMTCLYAWSGWIVTAIVYVMASLIIKFASSFARDEVVKHNLA